MARRAPSGDRTVESTLLIQFKEQARALDDVRKLSDLVDRTSVGLADVQKLGGLGVFGVGSEQIQDARAQLIGLSKTLETQKGHIAAVRAEMALLALEGKKDTEGYIELTYQLIEAQQQQLQTRAQIALIPQQVMGQQIAGISRVGGVFGGAASFTEQAGAGALADVLGGGEMEEFAEETSKALGEISKFAGVMAQFITLAQEISSVANTIESYRREVEAAENAEREALETALNHQVALEESAGATDVATEAALRGTDANEAVANSMQQAVEASEKQAAATALETAVAQESVAVSQQQAAAEAAVTASSEAATLSLRQMSGAMATQAVTGIQSMTTQAAALATTAVTTATTIAAALAPIIAIGVAYKVGGDQVEKATKVQDEWIASFPELIANQQAATEIARTSSRAQLDIVRETEALKLEEMKQQRDTQQQFVDDFESEVEKRVGGASGGFLLDKIGLGDSTLGTIAKIDPLNINESLSSVLLFAGDLAGLDTDAAEENIEQLNKSIKEAEENLKDYDSELIRNIIATGEFILAQREYGEVFYAQQQALQIATTEDLTQRIETAQTELELLRNQRNAIRERLATEEEDNQRVMLLNELSRLDTAFADAEQQVSILTDSTVALVVASRDREASLLREMELVDEASVQQVDQTVANLERQKDALQAVNVELVNQLDTLEPYSDEWKAVNNEITENSARLIELQREFTLWNTTVREAAEERQAEIDTIDQLRDLENKRAQALQNVSQQLKANTEQLQEAEQALEDFTAAQDLENERNAIRATYEERIEAAVAAEKVADLESSIAEQRASYAETSEESIKQHNKTLLENDQAYMESELDALVRFKEEEAKLTADYNKRRVRMLEDLHDTLLGHVKRNDVVSFIQAQEDAKKQLRRNQEDFDEGTKERQDQYDKDRALALKNLREQRADLVQSFKEQSRIRYEAHLETVRNMREQANQQLKQSDKLREELANQEEQWRVLDEQTRRIEQEKQLRDNVEQLRNQHEVLLRTQAFFRGKQVELDTRMYKVILDMGMKASEALAIRLNLLDQAANTGVSVLAGVIQNVRAQTTQRAQTLVSGVRGLLPSFADGGIATRPMVAVVGDRPGYHEAMIPFRPGQFPGGNITIDASNWNIGELVEKSDLDAVQERIEKGVVEGIRKAKGMV